MENSSQIDQSYFSLPVGQAEFWIYNDISFTKKKKKKTFNC